MNRTKKQNLGQMGLGERITVLRRHKNLSQADLALMSGIAPAHISIIESGQREPRLSTLQKISQALGVDVQSLVNGEIPEPGSVSASDMIRVGSYLIKQGRTQKRKSA